MYNHIYKKLSVFCLHGGYKVKYLNEYTQYPDDETTNFIGRIYISYKYS
jgi:hypothetical protein